MFFLKGALNFYGRQDLKATDHFQEGYSPVKPAPASPIQALAGGDHGSFS